MLAPRQAPWRRCLRTPLGLVLVGFALLGAVLLGVCLVAMKDHPLHLLLVLPYVLLVVSPLVALAVYVFQENEAELRVARR